MRRDRGARTQLGAARLLLRAGAMRNTFALLVVFAIGCNHSGAKVAGNPPPGTGGNGSSPDGGALPPPPSSNPIDVAIWPRALAAGITHYTPASTTELCRRVSL